MFIGPINLWVVAQITQIFLWNFFGMSSHVFLTRPCKVRPIQTLSIFVIIRSPCVVKGQIHQLLEHRWQELTHQNFISV